MSYILDALRRAEHDRRNAQSTPIEQVAMAAQPQAGASAHGNRRLLPVIVLVLLASLALGAYALWRQHHARDVAPVARLPVLIPAGPPMAKTKQASPIAGPQPSPAAKRSTRSSTATPAPINPIADAGRLSRLQDLMPPPKPAPRVRVRQPAASSAGRSGSQAVPAPSAVTSSPDTVITAPVAPASQATSTTQGANTQALKAMPDSYRENFPQITVQVHVYDDDPAKRWALIDGNRYKEGDTLPQGPKIYKIVPAGIVFDWRGQRVLYPVGS